MGLGGIIFSDDVGTKLLCYRAERVIFFGLLQLAGASILATREVSFAVKLPTGA
jgi:hypothetical protein